MSVATEQAGTQNSTQGTQVQQGAGDAAAAALAVALGLGAGTTALQALCGPRFIALTGCSPNLVAPACSYLRVRLLAAPAVVITMVAQVPPRSAAPGCRPRLCAQRAPCL